LNEPRIFLCHASEDKPRVAELYHKLKAAGYHPWLDKEDLLPGQDWRHEIEKVIRDPYNIVVVCLSCNSVTKRGVVQQEIKWALDVLDQTPEGTIYLIPARLEDCQVPDRLSKLHWVELFDPDGFEKLRQALGFEIGKRRTPVVRQDVEPKKKLLATIFPRQPFEPEMILIPAGEFLMGRDPEKDKNAYSGEQPQHRVYLPDYYMARTPVTNAQYAAFVKAADHKPPGYWVAKKPAQGLENHPVVEVSWHDAMAYCGWLVEIVGRPYRLPSEAEWEKAARGADGAFILEGMSGMPSGAIPRKATKRKLHWWAAIRRERVPMVCWTWPAMCGSGRSAFTGHTRTDRVMGAKTRAPRAPASCVAVRGFIVEGTRASPTVTSIFLSTSAAMWVFGLSLPLFSLLSAGF
jgi:hypothetical protein